MDNTTKLKCDLIYFVGDSVTFAMDQLYIADKILEHIEKFNILN